jgi:glycosyltransferase involved in cell wall biosynthesis
VFQRDTEEDELAYLYRNAVCFVFPSRYEGFGIPLLEAFACGAPVAASHATSLPEIAGDAAVYFDPCDKDSILNAVRGLVQNEGLREELRARGHNRCHQFSWEETARRTAEVYTRVVNMAAV